MVHNWSTASCWRTVVKVDSVSQKESWTKNTKRSLVGEFGKFGAEGNILLLTIRRTVGEGNCSHELRVHLFLFSYMKTVSTIYSANAGLLLSWKKVWRGRGKTVHPTTEDPNLSSILELQNKSWNKFQGLTIVEVFWNPGWRIAAKEPRGMKRRSRFNLLPNFPSFFKLSLFIQQVWKRMENK